MYLGRKSKPVVDRCRTMGQKKIASCDALLAYLVLNDLTFPDSETSVLVALCFEVVGPVASRSVVVAVVRTSIPLDGRDETDN